MVTLAQSSALDILQSTGAHLIAMAMVIAFITNPRTNGNVSVTNTRLVKDARKHVQSRIRIVAPPLCAATTERVTRQLGPAIAIQDTTATTVRFHVPVCAQPPTKRRRNAADTAIA